MGALACLFWETCHHVEYNGKDSGSKDKGSMFFLC
jgi:hypothetical protein